MAYIIERITLEQVRDEVREQLRQGAPAAIHYGFRSCWWTHRAADLRALPNGLPCDPAGGVLMTAPDALAFLDHAAAHPETYGRNGLEAFLAAHNDNCVASPHNHGSVCLRTWDEVNALLDYQRRREAAQSQVSAQSQSNDDR